MHIINEIIRQSAIGPLSKWYQSAILLVFSSIVVILFTMLVVLIANASQLTTNFSYLFNGNI
jgi:lipopolysaccharide/colanic/teichoic acid biosynthesis glycosyltransferase